MTEQQDKLVQLMTAIGMAQAEIPAMYMDGYNPYFSSRYTTLGTILETITPILNKHGLVVTQHATGSEGQVGIETIVAHLESKQHLVSRVLIPLGSVSNPAQEAGKIFTYLRRYALAALFNIYSDEDIDANTHKQQGAKEEEVDEPDVEELIENFWKPLAALADDLNVEYAPLPPDVNSAQLEKMYVDLQEKVEKAK
jgi:hypothetical protein